MQNVAGLPPPDSPVVSPPTTRWAMSWCMQSALHFAYIPLTWMRKLIRQAQNPKMGSYYKTFQSDCPLQYTFAACTTITEVLVVALGASKTEHTNRSQILA